VLQPPLTTDATLQDELPEQEVPPHNGAGFVQVIVPPSHVREETEQALHPPLTTGWTLQDRVCVSVKVAPEPEVLQAYPEGHVSGAQLFPPQKAGGLSQVFVCDCVPPVHERGAEQVPPAPSEYPAELLQLLQTLLQPPSTFAMLPSSIPCCNVLLGDAEISI